MILRRLFNSFSVFYNKYSGREGRCLMKILNKSTVKKKSNESIVTEYVKGLNPRNKESKRRIFVLNKLFMKYITDLMATGNTSGDLIGRGIEISRVSVTPDYNYVQVFWISKNPSANSEIEAKLIDVAHRLHHELTQLRLMGRIPKIKFVRDIFQLKLKEVEESLNKASFGPPSVEQNESITNEIETMPMTVYGLDHEKIMLRIKSLMSRQKAVHRMKYSLSLSNEDVANSKYDLSVNKANLSYIEKIKK